jgi:hypothetical protein
MLKKAVKKWFFYNNDCTACATNTYGGSFYFIGGKLIVPDLVYFNSDDFFNDTGRPDNTGPYPQS